MTAELWIAYVATILVLMSTPGPSHLLMLSNSLRHGFRPSMATAAGDLSANMLQMLAAGFGLAGALYASETAFQAVKWAGVAYLVWLGVRLLLRREAAGDVPRAASRRRLYMQGFITSAANPKAVIFFAALFPQFIDPAQPLGSQLALLGATYVAIDGLFLATYGYFSGAAGRALRGSMRRVNRLSGAILIGAAVLLGLKDVRDVG